MNQADSLLSLRGAAAACFAAIQLGIASAALAQCPESTLQYPFVTPPVITTEPTFDVQIMRGDHRTGEFFLFSSGGLAWTSLLARDRYDVTGVPPGTQVQANLQLRIEGWAYTAGCGGAGCCAYMIASLRAGQDSVGTILSGQTWGGRADFRGVVEFPVTLTAGTPLDILVEMRARRCPGGSHTLDATGRIVFVGTDERAGIVSCKGFSQATVPTRPTSWGRLKSIYR